MDSTNYVVGFLFRRNNTEVALIRKNNPDWQRGKLNGIGGKVESGESSRQAMVREFQEETGCEVLLTDWRYFLTLKYPEATIIFFASSVDILQELTTTTDEVVGWWTVSDLINEVTIPNLRWLLPLALDETQPAGVLNGN